MVGRNKDKAGARERVCSSASKESMRRSTKKRKPERPQKVTAQQKETMGPALAKLDEGPAEAPPDEAEVHEEPEEEETTISKRFDRGKMQNVKYVCPYTKKQFKSEGAWENYKGSKKYKQLVAKHGAKEEIKEETPVEAPKLPEIPTLSDLESDDESEEEVMTRPQMGGFSALGMDDEEEEEEQEEDGGEDDEAMQAALEAMLIQPRGKEAEEGAKSAQGDDEDVWVCTSISHNKEGDDKAAAVAGEEEDEEVVVVVDFDEDEEDEEWDEEDWEEEAQAQHLDDEVEWEPVWGECLFDGHTSKSFEENASYMQSKYSFFSLDMEALEEQAMPLFTYLQEKICRYHECLYCHRAFDSLEACRHHMVDKAHCKVNFESDPVALKLSKFREYGRSFDTDEAGKEIVEAEGPCSAKKLFWHLDAIEENPYDLVLPDGRKLGHRSLKVYYKQKFKKEDPLAVRINKKVASYRTFKFMGDHGMGDLTGKMSLAQAQKKMNGIMVRSQSFAKGNSKAIASQFCFKQGAADNAAARSLQHHGYGGFGGGAHFTMHASKQFNKGIRVKGVVSRKAKGGTKMQAAANKANRGNASMNAASSRGK